ncbi:uncharacterized protein LOC123297368 [Chrysoperla carnea]|uniref:uncharacterized protein LOC123297368 n=1 Tax=Chrysoperla carnea TaxID=189513 RepID=UPI001D06F8EC|nr:uncharacterized protein LOC123297368 [Chrysoperla carnea]
MKFNIILSTCLMLIIFTFQQTTFVNCTDYSGIDPVAETGLPPLISELNKKLTVCEELKQLTDEKIQEFCKSTEYSVYMKCVEYNKKKFQEQKRRMKRHTDCDLDCDQDDICDNNICQNSCRSCGNDCNECNSCSRCTSQTCCHRHCHRQCITTSCRRACVNNCVNTTSTSNNAPNISHTSNTTVLNSYNLTTSIKFTNYINTSNVVDIPININTTNINNITLTEQVSNTERQGQELCCYITTPTECVNITVAPYVQCIHRRHKVCGQECYQPAPPPPPPVVIRVPYPIPQPYTVVQTVRVPQPIPVERAVLVRQPFPVPQPYPVRQLVQQPIPIPQPYPVREVVRQYVPVPQPYPVRILQPVPFIQPQPQPIPIPQPVPIQPVLQPILYPPRPSCPLCGVGGCQQVSGMLTCRPYGPNFGYYGSIGSSPISMGAGSLPLYGSGGIASQVLYSTGNTSNLGIENREIVQQPSPLIGSTLAQFNTDILGSDPTIANQNVLNTAGASYALPATGQMGGYAYDNQLGGYGAGAPLGGYIGGAQLGAYPGSVQYSTDQLGQGYGAGGVQYIQSQPGVQYATVTGNQTVPIQTLPGVLSDQSNIGQYQYAGVANANVYPGTGTYSAIGNPGTTYNMTSTDTSTARPYGLHQFFNN